MSVERWRMQSGRIASIDLSGHPDAVSDARVLLRMNGAEPINEDAPDAGKSVEGEITSTPEEEHDMNDIIIPDTADVRDSIRSWAVQYAAQTEDAVGVALNDPDFQERAAEKIRRLPDLTIDTCARRWVDDHSLVSVPWPDAATPAGWNVDVGTNLSGEVTVSIDVEIDDPEIPTVGAALGVLIAVVVDIDPSRTRTDAGVEVGDYFVSQVTISHWGVEQTSDADAALMKALSRVLLRAADALPAVIEFSRQLGGSERPLETPNGKPAEEVR